MSAPLVYPLPPILPTNPYLDQLYAPMAGMHIHLRRGRPRTELLALLLAQGPRILHLHFFDELTQRPERAQTAIRSLAFLGLLTLLRQRGVRLIWTAHNLEPHELYHHDWAERVYRRVARWSDATIAHSQAAKRLVEQRYHPRRCVVIPQGHYIGLYGPCQEQATSRIKLGLPVGERVTLCFGTLRPYKHIEGLIEAFAALPQATRGILLIAGAAKERAYAEQIRQCAAGVPGVRVDLRFVPDSELPAYFAAADVVALPYRRMLTSAILLMAMSYARPLIAPAFEPVSELITEGHEGFLFTPGDPAALTAALGRALAHPDLDALGRQAIATARRFDWRSSAQQLAELYQSLEA